MDPVLVLLVLSLSASVHGQQTTQNATAMAIRLAHGGSEFRGRLEVQLQGVWGTVCIIGFDDVDGDVACRQLLGMGQVRSVNFATQIAKYAHGRS